MYLLNSSVFIVWFKGKVYIICFFPPKTPYLGENVIPGICTKMLLANQIAGFLNQIYPQNKMMKKSIFLHVVQSGRMTLKLVGSQE